MSSDEQIVTLSSCIVHVAVQVRFLNAVFLQLQCSELSIKKSVLFTKCLRESMFLLIVQMSNFHA